MEIKNTVAFVTGAASGLGLATCKVLVEAGARVMAVDLDEARLASDPEG
jgi:NAD(P)-dependent dehydrogenase (short-subunit alcohol dehydrogenase family)